MTTFYFRRSVEKAFQLDEQPSDLSLNLNRPVPPNAPYITSAVDDVMYIVNQVVRRSLATSQRDIVASAVPTIARVLSTDFVGMVQRKMRDENRAVRPQRACGTLEQRNELFLGGISFPRFWKFQHGSFRRIYKADRFSRRYRRER